MVALMIKLNTFLIWIGLFSFTSYSQFLFGIGSTGTDYCKDITIDTQKNIVAAGYIWNTIDFDPGVGTYFKNSNGLADNFVAKYDSSGSFKLAITFGSTGVDIPHSVVTDLENNIILCGYFTNTCDFDPGTGQEIRTSNGGRDAYIAKFDSDGILQWVLTYGGDGLDDAFNLDVDNSGNIYWTGVIEDTVTIGNNTFITRNEDIIFGKISPTGNLVWSKQIGGSGVDEGSGVIIDNNGDLIHTGYFQSTVDFDPDDGESRLISSGNFDTFFGKYDTDGKIKWVKKIGGTGADIPAPGGIEIDNQDNIYISGNAGSNCDYDPGSELVTYPMKGGTDWFVAKYDKNGNHLLSFTVGGIEQDQAHRLCVDPDYNIYVTGWFRVSADFNPRGSPLILTGNCTGGGHDGYIAKYNSNGICIWAKQFGAAVDGPDMLTLGTSVKLLWNSKILFAGRYHGIDGFRNIDSSQSINNLGSSDIFISVLNSDGSIDKKNQQSSIKAGSKPGKTGFYCFFNPAGNLITIRSGNKPSASCKIAIYSLKGSVIKSQPYTNIVDVTEIPSGTYILTVSGTDKNKKYSQTIIKQ